MALKTDKTVPGREDRIGACVAYGGSACGLGGENKGCLKTAERGFSQAGLCQLLPTLGMLLTLQDATLVVHGALGCASAGFPMNVSMRLHHIARGDKNAPDAVWVSTNLRDKEVVHGGEARLEETLLEVDRRYKPKAIIALNTCTPAIIGDDFESVVENVRSKISTPILASSCAGFRTKIWATGYDVAFHAIVHGFIEKDKEGRPPRRPEGSKRERPLVNVINLASVGKPDEEEMRRLLNELDIDVIIGPNFGNRELVRSMTQADLTVSVCPTHDDYFVDYLRQEYGIPAVLRDMPIGLANTRRWLVEIADHFGRGDRAKALADREEARAKQAVQPHLGVLKNKRAYLSAGEFRALVTASLLQELGLEVVGLRSYHHDDFGTEFYAQLVAANGDKDIPISVANFQPFELVNVLRKVRPDLFVGHIWDNVWAAREGLPAMTIFRLFDHYVGYRGYFEVAKKASRVMRNFSFNQRLSEHAREGYRPSWIEGSPFKYIKARTETSSDESQKVAEAAT